ncbi:MAG: AmpE protein [Halieaceae bacterium]|jgi:AmpE protein
MTFITIILAWGLVQHWGSATPVHNDDWFDRWCPWVGERVEQPLVAVALLVLCPSVGVALLANVVQDALFGLLYLGIGVVVLLYAFGRGDFDALIAGYGSRRRRGDNEGAFLYASIEMGLDLDAADGNDFDALHDQVKREVLYRGFERWFAVVFYFILLGVAGALLYRLLHLLTARDDSPEHGQIAETVIDALDWLPSRLLVFAFALTGNFTATMAPLSDSLQDIYQPTEDLLSMGAEAAMSSVSEGEFEGEQGAIPIADLSGLLSRSAAAWIGVIAVLTIVI